MAAIMSTMLLAAGTTSLRAEDGGHTGPYFTADGGLSLLEDITSGYGGITGTVSSKPGFRLSIAGGYDFYASSSMSVGAELETGLLWNSLDSVTAGGSSASLSGNFLQVPVLANLVAKFQAGQKWSVYLGGGGGMVFNNLTVDSVGGSPADLSANETDAAVQGMAGLLYKLNENSEIGVGYKFLATFPEGIDRITSHAFSLVYSLRF